MKITNTINSLEPKQKEYQKVLDDLQEKHNELNETKNQLSLTKIELSRANTAATQINRIIEELEPLEID